VAILALLLVNIDFWFARPFSPNQLLSWAFLLASLFLVVPGFRLLRSSGRPSEEREDAALVGMEKTTTLVTTGIYHYIRHPLYSSLLFLTWGVFFKHPSWIGITLAVLASVLLTTTARIEEWENIRFFGQAYKDYMKETRMFLPFLF
jgi:protein-S-isoprenylcysteine O-methyltransferase Ste14